MDSVIMIEAGQVQLEAMIAENTTSKAVIVTHPHPLYGGNMENPVVMTASRAFFDNGFTTLRFNFRGTGKSTGRFDDGIGEQDDVRAAVSYLKEKGLDDIRLCGYSFGSRINASVVSEDCSISDHIMVSPPVAFMSFDDIFSMPKTGLVITGSHDEIAPPGQVQTHLTRWEITPEYQVIESCDHFYSGCLDRLEDILNRYLS